jgi:uncharacterized membrane protein YoaK (UPF0700 family)
VTGADPGRREVALLLVMVVAAAATDAISYLGLGKVFPANMTGNTVLLGIGLATGDMTHAAHSGVALGGFVLGAAFAGGRPHGPARWARGPSLDAYVETALVLAAFLWWHLGAPPKMALIGMLAIAMGMQSAAITRLDLGVSTTFITGTWTSASAWLGRLVTGSPRRRPRGTQCRPWWSPGTWRSPASPRTSSASGTRGRCSFPRPRSPSPARHRSA